MHQIKFKLSIDLPPSNIRRPIFEMKLLREALSRDESFGVVHEDNFQENTSSITTKKSSK